MELRLTVQRPNSNPSDVRLDADADTTAYEAASAIARYLGDAAEGAALRLERTETVLPPATPIAASGVRQGDVVALVRAAEPLRSRELCEIEVVRGRDRGRRARFPAGEIVVGRDPERCAFVLTDPQVSAVHLRLAATASGIDVVDLASRHGTSVSGSRLGASDSRRLAPSDTVEIGESVFVVRESRHATGRDGDHEGVVPFNRPPRAVVRVVHAAYDVGRVPSEAPKPRLPVAVLAGSAVMGVGSAIMFSRFEMLTIALIGPVVTAISYLEDRRAGGKTLREAETKFRERVRAVTAEVATARAREREARLAAAPAVAELVERARAHAATVWERRAGDPDLLRLRVGRADLRSSVETRVDDSGSERLRADAEREFARNAILEQVPVVADLATTGSIGVSGPHADPLARSLVAQAAALHSPRDLAIAAAISPSAESEWSWLKWLPHTTSEGPLRRSLLATETHDAVALLESVAALLRERSRERDARRTDSGPTVLVVLDHRLSLPGPLVSKVLSASSALGVVGLWIGDALHDVPGDCRGVIETGEEAVRWTASRDADSVSNIVPDALSVEDATDLARALSPLRDISAEAEGARLPQRVDLFELLGVTDVSPQDVAARWRSSRGLSAAVGRTAQGVFSIDLPRDGPHALVAGTTGAGKSELLETMIVSLAAAAPPDRLTYLLVDYKGGAAFRECTALPHTAGFVTDLDEHLANRALISLNAELKRRERVLDELGVKDISAAARKDPTKAPARLLIVIDEFATLAKEIPAFVEGVVDIAQRGRSLGVHLILATQRPAGVVTANIRANTNLRIALRVSDASESEDVIGLPDAAYIARDRPGRGYARLGQEPASEFQAAYSGSAVLDIRAPTLSVRPFLFGVPRSKPALATITRLPPRRTQLARLVEAVTQAADSAHLQRAPAPWLPPLPDAVTEESVPLDDKRNDRAMLAVIGLADDPSQQLQHSVVFDLDGDGSLLAYGATGSGKTTLLRTIAFSLARRYPVDALHMYGIDMSTGGLKAIESLPHCGGVIVGHDEERAIRMLKWLRAEIDHRRSTASDHQRDAGSPLPRVLVLVNGYGGFSAAYEKTLAGELVDSFPRLVADGAAVGIHFAITADRRGVVPGALSGVVSRKLILRMSDEDEYISLGVPRKLFHGMRFVPGRAVADERFEMQIAVASNDATARGQMAALAEIASAIPARAMSSSPRVFGALPSHIPLASLVATRESWSAPIGVFDDDVSPAATSMRDGNFLVIGPYGSGRSNAVTVVASGLARSTPGVGLHLVQAREGEAQRLGIWMSIATGEQQCLALLSTLALTGAETMRCLVIDDGEALLEGECAALLLDLVRSTRNSPTRVVAAVERQSARRAFDGWVAELRKEGRGLLLQVVPELDGDLLSARLPRSIGPLAGAGRGHLVARGVARVVQVARA